MICLSNRNQLRDLLFDYHIILILPLPMIVALVIAGAGAYASARQSDTKYDTLTSWPHFDENKFITEQPDSYSVASSPPLLRNLAENEEIVYTLIKDFYSRFGPRTFDNINDTKAHTLPQYKLMHSYLKNFEITSGSLQLNLKKQTTEDHNSMNRAFKIAWNPLSTFFMLRRVLDTLKEIIRNFDPTQEAQLNLQNQILHLMKSGGWPVEDDVKYALSAILRIQHVYDLSTFEISSGILAGFQTNLNLSAEDCVQIGDEALVKEGLGSPFYALAVEWFEEAQRRKLREGISSLISQRNREIDDYLRYAIQVHDDEWSSGGEIRDTLFFTTRCNYSQPLLSRTRRRTAELASLNSVQDLYSLNEIKYWGTCSGQNYQSEADRAKLFCWYETAVSPYHRINPLKAELLSIEPHPIIQYYDMIGDQMISMLKSETSHGLSHSTVYTDSVKTTYLTSFRASSSSLVDDNTLDEFRSIPLKIKAVMGLTSMRSLTSSELLQVGAYTSGGHYSLHLDALKVFSENMSGERNRIYLDGDRMSTFMFYLGDVEKGGGTSFPMSGIAIQPVKGSAVLWFNSMRNGGADYSSWHGACPVIIGEKWIANKWILSLDQMFHKDYQCVPDQTARFGPKIIGKNLMDLV